MNDINSMIDGVSKCLEKYCGYGFLSDKDGRPILMSLLGNMDVEGTSHITCVGNVTVLSQLFANGRFCEVLAPEAYTYALALRTLSSDKFKHNSLRASFVQLIVKSRIAPLGVPIGMLKSVASLDYIKFSLAAIEKGLQLCAQKAKQPDLLSSSDQIINLSSTLCGGSAPFFLMSSVGRITHIQSSCPKSSFQ
uniref:Glutaminase n=1 Tax=Angiostrongylus cantonensis TaxID=6313 RepID=A0A0K0D5F8_ANGCA